MSGQKRHKIFIAINVPHDIRKYLAGFAKKWPDLPAKWVSLDNLHITLIFLGDLTDEELGQVCVVVKEVVKNHPSFNIALDKVAYGPEGKLFPRYIWVGGKKVKKLSSLKKDLENALSEVVHLPQDNKSFSPHITLAKISAWKWQAFEPEERPEVGQSIDVIFAVESIEVMESELKKGSLRYTIVESCNLQFET